MSAGGYSGSPAFETLDETVRVFVRRGSVTRAYCVGTIHRTADDPIMRLRSVCIRCSCHLVLVESARVTAMDNNSVTFGCARHNDWAVGDIVGRVPWAKDRDGTGFGGVRKKLHLRRK